MAGVARVEAGVVQVASSELPTRGERVAHRRRYVADELLVRFRPGVGDQEVRAAHGQVGGRVARVIPRIGVHVVKLPPGADPDRALTSYRTFPGVQWAERNAYVYVSAAPNDPLYATHQWHYPLVRLPQAWDVVMRSPPDRGGGGYGRAVRPSGPAGPRGRRWDFVDGDADASDPGCPLVDPTEPSHGTHVAGTEPREHPSACSTSLESEGKRRATGWCAAGQASAGRTSLAFLPTHSPASTACQLRPAPRAALHPVLT